MKEYPKEAISAVAAILLCSEDKSLCNVCQKLEKLFGYKYMEKEINIKTTGDVINIMKVVNNE